MRPEQNGLDAENINSTTPPTNAHQMDLKLDLLKKQLPRLTRR